MKLHSDVSADNLPTLDQQIKEAKLISWSVSA